MAIRQNIVRLAQIVDKSNKTNAVHTKSPETQSKLRAK